MPEERELHPPEVAFEMEGTLRVVYSEIEDGDARAPIMSVEYAESEDALGAPVWLPVEEEAAMLLAIALVDALGTRPSWVPSQLEDPGE